MQIERKCIINWHYFEYKGQEAFNPTKFDNEYILMKISKKKMLNSQIC